MSNEELVLMIQRDQDKDKCLEELYLNNIGMISKVAYKYSAYAEYDDLMQEAFIGMLKAVELWRGDRGTNFMTYAYHWMCQAVQRYISNCGSTVRIPDNQLYQIIKYEKAVKDALMQNPRGLSDKELSWYLGIDESQVRQLKKDARMHQLKSLDEPRGVDNEYATLGDSVADERNDFETMDDQIQNEELAQVLWPIVDSLEPMQAETIRARYQDGLTFEQTAKRLELSRDKVRRTENMAFRRLRSSKNEKKLKPFLSDESIYSISTRCSGYGSFKNSWISAPERVVLLEEKRARGITDT